MIVENNFESLYNTGWVNSSRTEYRMIIELGLLALLVFAVLVVIGILIIIFVIGSLIMFLPATIIAIVVLLLTGSWYFAGIAFLIIAVLMIIFRK